MNSTPPPPGDKSPTGEWNLAPGQTIAGRYLLKRILGQGGMGVIWLAHDTRLREAVALKFLPAHVAGDTVALERLRRETLRSRKLSHPNIVRIHDFHEAPGEPAFISMEYVEGRNFHYLRVARPSRVLAWNYVAPLAVQLCEALHYAHSEGVIHRDLKPANLILESTGRVKLADFGLAQVSREPDGRVRKEEVAGTAAYMSPQQASGQSPAVSDDIYSFGVTLYELLTSEPPFHTGDIPYQIQNTRPQPLNERLLEMGLTNDKIPSQISALIMACLAKDPAQRPASAQAILDWLREPRNEAAPVEEPAVAAPGQPAPPRSKIAQPASAPPRDSAPSQTGWRAVILKIVAPVAMLAITATVVGMLWKSEPTRGIGRGSADSNPVETTASEYESLFNGIDFTGWSCDSRFWSIEEGTIVGRTPYVDGSTPKYTFLVWGEEVGDFELRLFFNCSANSGVSYRARRNSENTLTGYHAEIFSQGTGTLIFTQSTQNRKMGKAGERTVVRAAGNDEVIERIGATANATQLYDALIGSDWKEYVIVARGNRFQHWINGVLFADVTDENPRKFVASGRLALEFGPRNSYGKTVRFKDIRLKRLPPSASARGNTKAPQLSS